MCIAGRDVIAQAQSGTGKTATFSVAILEKIDLRVTKCQALILAPTRELAQQVRPLSCVALQLIIPFIPADEILSPLKKFLGRLK